MPYRLEYAKTSAAGCKGPKPCKGTKIQKGELRFGTVVEIQGNTTWTWRHYGCITPAVLANVIKELEAADPDLLDGFEEMREDDQEKIKKAFEEGHIDDADKSTHVLGPVDPLSLLTLQDIKDKLGEAGITKAGTKDVVVARLREYLGPIPVEDNKEDDKEDDKEEGGKKGKAKKPKKETEKPVKKTAPAKTKKAALKKAKKEESEEEEESAEESAESSAEESDEDTKPAKKRAKTSKTKAKKVKKEESDDEESDAKASGSDDGSDASPKRKSSKSKKAAPVVREKRKRASVKSMKEESSEEEEDDKADVKDEDDE